MTSGAPALVVVSRPRAGRLAGVGIGTKTLMVPAEGFVVRNRRSVWSGCPGGCTGSGTSSRILVATRTGTASGSVPGTVLTSYRLGESRHRVCQGRDPGDHRLQEGSQLVGWWLLGRPGYPHESRSWARMRQLHQSVRCAGDFRQLCPRRKTLEEGLDSGRHGVQEDLPDEGRVRGSLRLGEVPKMAQKLGGSAVPELLVRQKNAQALFHRSPETLADGLRQCLVGRGSWWVPQDVGEVAKQVAGQKSGCDAKPGELVGDLRLAEVEIQLNQPDDRVLLEEAGRGQVAPDGSGSTRGGRRRRESRNGRGQCWSRCSRIGGRRRNRRSVQRRVRHSDGKGG